MLEEWLWDATQAVLARIPSWPGWCGCNAGWNGSRPTRHWLIFLAPTVLLLPVKVLALLSITHGHPTLGLAIVLVAKVLGTALVARIYALTRRSLLSLDWFQRYHDKLLDSRTGSPHSCRPALAGARCSDCGRPPSRNGQAGRPQAAPAPPHACCACCGDWWPACANSLRLKMKRLPLNAAAFVAA
jgi:hypothetical protein